MVIWLTVNKHLVASNGLGGRWPPCILMAHPIVKAGGLFKQTFNGTGTKAGNVTGTNIVPNSSH